MDAVSGISAGTTYLMGTCGAPMTAAAGMDAAQPTSLVTGSGYSAISGSQTLIGNIAASSNKDLMAAMLLMLTLDYMRGDDSGRQKQDALALLSLMLQQGQSAGSSTLIYSFSEASTQIVGLQAVSGSMAAGAYASLSPVNGQMSAMAAGGSIDLTA